MSDESPENLEEGRVLAAIKDNLKQFRNSKNFSLDKLAARCGVSRAMLSQIEQGKSVPTISVLWKIANGLGVSFHDLLKIREETSVQVLKKKHSRVLFSSTRVFSSRALFPPGQGKSGFYELSLKPGGKEKASHPQGTTVNIVVAEGHLQITIDDKSYDLETGDSVFFRVESEHEYSNPSSGETRMFLVVDFDGGNSL